MRPPRYIAFLSLLLVAPLSACADTGRVVNVAPSAEHLDPLVQLAVERLNAATGEVTFVSFPVNDGERVDGEVVVRGARDLGIDAKGCTIIGLTTTTGQGVIIRLLPAAGARTVAHELGHATGLGHSPDPANLMYGPTNGGWALTPAQLEVIRGE